jgi:hypothetical protein
MFQRLHFTVLLLALSVFGHAQKKDTVYTSLHVLTAEIKSLQKKVFESKKETERFEANKAFLKLWEEVLRNPASLEHNFDSIRGVSILQPKNKTFRLITWNVFKNDGQQAYFGFIQANNKKVNKKGLFKKETTYEYEVFQLIDKSATITSPETHVGDPKKWYGMLYYDIIECDGFYTLLGWDGNDNLIQKKFIDVLYFKSDGTPVFGKDVFRIPKKSPKRIMFQYSAEVSMSLKYNPKRGQIIYSHLSPKDESVTLEGQYQYYGPDGSFDAMELKKDRWVSLEDVDIRNEKNANDEHWNDPTKPSKKKRKKVMPANKTEKAKE